MTGKLKKLRLATAALLALLLLVMIPMQALAQSSPQENPPAQEVVNTTPEAKILAEITEKRDAYTKHFLMDDETYTAVQYDSPVHYQDKDGNWVEYDNSMTEVETQPATEVPTQSPTEAVTAGTEFGTEPAATDAPTQSLMRSAANQTVTDDKEYENKKSNIDVRLSDKAKANNMVKVKTGGYQLSWGYADASKSRVEFVNHNEKLDGNEAFTTLKHISQEALYKDVYPNVDIQCFITSQGVKENLILKNKDAQTSFEMQYKSKGLTAIHRNDKTIDLKNSDGKTIYTISAPVMRDASGAESDAVSITLKDQENGKFTVEMNAGADWINEWGRSFPVAVDPDLNYGGAAGGVDSAHISSANPDTYYGMLTSNTLGNSAQYGKINTLYKMSSYPALGIGDRIVSATFSTYGASSADMTIKAHKITSDWALTKSSPIRATWNNVSYDSSVLDYVQYQTAAARPFTMEFDITQLAKEWYNGTTGKYGIALSSDDNNTATMGSAYDIYPQMRPVFKLAYKNFVGTEPNLTYHTHQVGTHIEGNVSDYLGSLTLKQTISEGVGSRMPVMITASYNSILKDTVFGNGSASGYGWQFSFNRYVSQPSSSLQAAGYTYAYTDEDGTTHYFKLKEDSTTEWEDEDGLNLTLTKDGSYLYITDSEQIVQKFTLPANGGRILSEKDQYNNTILYTYDTENNLTRITDGGGREYIITYAVNTTSNKRQISKITAPDGKAISFEYNYVANDKDRLIYIRYPYNNSTMSYTFGYTSGYLTSITAPDTSGMKYVFTDGRVSKVTELGKQSKEGGYLTVAYNTNNTTTYTDRQGRSETVTFDEGGTTVSTLNANGYINNSGESSKNTEVKYASGSESFTKNYITNSGAENTTGFTKKAWGTTDSGSFTNDKSTGLIDGEAVQYFGKGSFKIQQSSNTDFTTFYQTVSVAGLAGKKVTFSSYVKAKWTNSAMKDKGIIFRARYLNAQGQEISVEDGKIYPSNTAWQRLSSTFTVPSNASKIELHCGIKQNIGSAWFDCMQLESGECMNDYTALENGDFTAGGYWQGGQTITGVPTQQRALPQSITVNKANVAFNIYGSATGNSVPLKGDRKFGIKLAIYYADKTIPVEEHYQSFNEFTTAQQSACLLIEPKKRNQLISSVTFYFVYDYNLGTMKAYNAMVGFEYMGDTDYDNNETFVTNTADFTEVDTQPYQGSVYSYDTYGNTTKTEFGTVLTNAQGEEYLDKTKQSICSSSSYDSSGSYLLSETDSRGKTQKYTVNSTSGKITTLIDKNDNKVYYTYDVDTGNLLGIESQINDFSLKTNYSYDKGNNLISITQKDINYNLLYDNLNRYTSLKIGNNSLITNTYDQFGSNIFTSTYANGDEISYEYDVFGNLIKTNNDDGSNIQYIYNKKNLLAKIIDSDSGEISEFYYNIYGNQTKKMTYGAASNNYYEETLNNNNVSSKKLSIVDSDMSLANKIVTQSCDENGNSVIINDGYQSTEIQDALNRTQNIIITPTNKVHPVLTSDYTYLEGASNNQTTTLVKSISYKDINNKTLIKYGYIYDECGNITAVEENGVRTALYAYDEANQLISFADAKQNTYTFYTYDTNGNITNITTRGLSQNGWYPTVEISSKNYSYNDISWRDKITNINGQNITYDELGNPLTYRDGIVMTWKNGRQLSNVKKQGDDITYRYNQDGLRTYKCIANNQSTREVKYFYDDNKQLTAVSGLFGSVAYFYYDDNNKPQSMSYRGNTYYYVTNLQGDIISLLNSDGSVYANYTYDAFGKILSMTHADGSNVTSWMDVAMVNPLRYRGYVYDDELSLYYLQSRYYDPETGRFVNADVIIGSNGDQISNNLYNYCSNNFVLVSDPSGHKITVRGGFSQLSQYLYLLKQLTDDNLKISNGYVVISKRASKIRRKSGTELIRQLIGNKKICSVQATNKENSWMGSHASPANVANSRNRVGCNASVFLLPSQASKKNPLFIILGHELIHAIRMLTGVIEHSYPVIYWVGNKRYQAPYEELCTVGLVKYPYNYTRYKQQITENSIRKENGLALRQIY